MEIDARRGAGDLSWAVPHDARLLKAGYVNEAFERRCRAVLGAVLGSEMKFRLGSISARELLKSHDSFFESEKRTSFSCHDSGGDIAEWNFQADCISLCFFPKFITAVENDHARDKRRSAKKSRIEVRFGWWSERDDGVLHSRSKAVGRNVWVRYR